MSYNSMHISLQSASCCNADAKADAKAACKADAKADAKAASLLNPASS